MASNPNTPQDTQQVAPNADQAEEHAEHRQPLNSEVTHAVSPVRREFRAILSMDQQNAYWPMSPDRNPEVPPEDTEVRRIIYFENVKGFLESSQALDNLAEDRYESYTDTAVKSVFVLKKIVKVVPYDKGKKGGKVFIDSVKSEQIIIYSSLLLSAIRSVVQYWPTPAYYGSSKKLVLEKPYRSLVAHSEELLELARHHETRSKQDPQDEDSERSRKVASEVKLLMKEVGKVHSQQIKEEEARHRQNPPKATFDMLSMIFKPGTSVYTTIEGSEVAGRVKLVLWDRGNHLGRSSSVDDPYLRVFVNLWYLDYRGKCSTLQLYSPLQRHTADDARGRSSHRTAEAQCSNRPV
jgi:hypothetical protein